MVEQLELYPHQLKAVEQMHNGCILKGDVGSGKSLTSIMYFYTKVCGGIPQIKGFEYSKMKTPRDLYIFTTAKKRDKLEWEEELAAFGIGRESNEAGIQAHVDSWNNLSQYEMVSGAFVIFDEQRLVGNGAWVKTFQRLAKNNRWIVLSATPGDIWLDYAAVFVANGFYRNRTEFIRRHVVYNNYGNFPKVDHYNDTAYLERLRKQIIVEMPFARHTRRHTSNILVSYDKEKFDLAWKKRWNCYTDKPIKDVSELLAVVRRITNAEVDRLAAIIQLTEKHPRLIVFYNYDYELEMLRTLESTLGIPVREWNGHRHQPVPEDEKWIYLVQYTAGAEGWNCITTNAMAFFSLNYSYRLTEQGKGRIDRLNTPFVDLYYYMIRSMSPIDLLIMKALTVKKKFNESSFMSKKQWDEWVPF